MQEKKRLIKTNRIALIRSLSEIPVEIPSTATLEEWCRICETAFKRIGFDTYCHKSPQGPLYCHAEKYGEVKRYIAATYHCDLQHDISRLNRDTDDPSGANTDPLFPRDVLWVFQNDDANNKAINRAQLMACARKYAHVDLVKQYMIAKDGHKCLSSPGLFIQEFFIDNGIRHYKEGDYDEMGVRLTAYPYDGVLNRSGNGKQTDWVIEISGKREFVEYFEGHADAEYGKRVDAKRTLCKKHGIHLIELWRNDLPPQRLKSLLK
jgi:hypothetical protein